MKLILTTLLVVLAGVLYGQSYIDKIHVDQFGYQRDGSKVAVISDPQSGYNASESFIPSATLQLINNQNGSVAFSGSVNQWNGGATQAFSGDRGWWFDFSSITQDGEYYVLDPVQNVRSDVFRIADDVYVDVLKAACRAFYYNRCNMAKEAPYTEPNWVDGDNFNNPDQDTDCIDLNDQNNPARRKDLSGGWWDAGDNNKYVTFASDPVHNLLSAYEDYPDAFPDNWNIPESNNSIPDIVDEVDWEIQWLKKMQESNGRVIIKMGNIDYNHNASTPPSVNTDPRYYGPTCTSSTLAFAGMLAHAAIVYDGISGLSGQVTDLQAAAINAWDAVIDDLTNNTLEYDCDDGTIKSGDADRNDTQQRELALVAAIYLYELTSDASYNNYVINNISDASNVSGGWWGPYTTVLNEAVLRYTTLTGSDSDTNDRIINSFRPHVQGDWDGFYGFNTGDLYRAFAPDYMFGWGSNSTLSSLGTLNTQAADYNIDPANEDDLNHKAEEMLHYFHGVNPQNIVYLSNMGALGAEYSANEIYHFWFWDGTDYDNAQSSLYGPTPGFLTGGANSSYTVSTVSPPYGQPIMKSYKDWNTSSPENSWEITEPAIYYQAAYIRLLARFTQSNAVLPVEFIAFDVIQNELDNSINWSTTSEMNVDYFRIDRSEDTMNWTSIGQVQARGSGSMQEDYSYDDVDVWLNSPDQWYYRLGVVDVDGAESFSDIRMISRQVTTTSEFSEILERVYPNPCTDQLSIIFNPVISSDFVTLAIYSISGSLLEEKDYTVNSDKVKVDMTKYDSGIYILKIKSTDNTATINLSSIIIAK